MILTSFSPVEPRLGLSYQLDEKQKFGLGLGLHSKIQSPYLYIEGEGGRRYQERVTAITEYIDAGHVRFTLVLLTRCKRHDQDLPSRV
jgi:hypothetical protein